MKQLVLRAIRAYQHVSRSLPPNPVTGLGVGGCRSWPTCSEYAYEAVGRYGVLRGTVRALLRFIRCSTLWPAWQHTT